jgi:signal transduction histidine kinase
MERLERAVFQLLDNAIKASSQGGVVEMRWMLQPGPRTRIELLDRGPGMPADVMRSLGSAFLKHDVSAERSWPGAGLGLALACRVAAAHGGALTVEGREGGGSRVALTIPHHGAG